MFEFIMKALLPGIVLILIGFWMGTLSSMLFSLIGFLSCFLIGVTLIVEGWKEKKKHET